MAQIRPRPTSFFVTEAATTPTRGKFLFKTREDQLKHQTHLLES